MKILKISTTNEKEALTEAISVLKKGGVIAHPTETVWGFAADANNKKAVRKVHKLKETDPKKQLLWNLPSKNWLNLLGQKLCKAHKLTKKFWPGPLSLVIQSKNSGTIGVRYPDHPLSNKLARFFGKPLITTSANLKNKAPAKSAEAIKKVFQNKKNQPDLILDDGSKSKAQPSTIVDVSTREVCLIREGAIEFKKVLQVLARQS